MKFMPNFSALSRQLAQQSRWRHCQLEPWSKLKLSHTSKGRMASELILLVDDETNITDLAELYLKKEGYRTQAVGDGASALDAVRQKQPALLILDLMLPKLDGYEVCRRLRAENNSLPILMLTARDDDVDKIVGLEMGADDYLTKPFNPRELVARVKALLR